MTVPSRLTFVRKFTTTSVLRQLEIPFFMCCVVNFQQWIIIIVSFISRHAQLDLSQIFLTLMFQTVHVCISNTQYFLMLMCRQLKKVVYPGVRFVHTIYKLQIYLSCRGLCLLCLSKEHGFKRTWKTLIVGSQLLTYLIYINLNNMDN